LASLFVVYLVKPLNGLMPPALQLWWFDNCQLDWKLVMMLVPCCHLAS